MTSTGKVLPKDVIANWPEVFGDIKLNVMPLGYVHAVLINFRNGKTWEIKITSQVKKDGWSAFEKNLSEMVKRYESEIVDVDFKLDTHKVKKDIEHSTQKFLKKKKL